MIILSNTFGTGTDRRRMAKLMTGADLRSKDTRPLDDDDVEFLRVYKHRFVIAATGCAAATDVGSHLHGVVTRQDGVGIVRQQMFTRRMCIVHGLATCKLAR